MNKRKIRNILPDFIECGICCKSFKKDVFSRHIKIHKILLKEYYDKYLKKEDEGICKMCGNGTNFSGRINSGYFDYCSTGCCNRNKETKKSKSKKFKGVKRPEYIGELVRKSRLGSKASDETKAKLSRIRKGKPSPLRGRKLSEEHKLHISDSIKGEKNPNWGKKFTEEFKAMMREKRKKENLSVETIKKMSESHKKLFDDPEYRKRRLKGFGIKPTKPEIFLTGFISSISDEYEYVGDWSISINGKNPDFINHKKKKVIEFFGPYWHDEIHTGKQNCIHEYERIEHFEKNGYTCLVIWYYDLKNLDLLKERIIKFDSG